MILGKHTQRRGLTDKQRIRVRQAFVFTSVIMCTRPFVGRAGNFYLHIYPIPANLTDNDIYRLFSEFGPIRHLEAHRASLQSEELDGHCFIGYGELRHAVHAMQFSRGHGNFRFEMNNFLEFWKIGEIINQKESEKLQI